MNFVYFWTVLVTLLVIFGYWRIIFLISVWKAICYLLWDYDERAPDNDFKVCIVGAGFSGIGMGIKLKRLGIEYMIYETAPEVGGTWFSNVYPGCACDIQAHLYSYSFEPNPFWSRKFAPQEEIWNYLRDVVRRNRVKVQYNTRVESIRWNKVTKQYTVNFSDGTSKLFNAVVYGAGALRTPTMPDFVGQGDFQGTSMHSAIWDKTRGDVAGKRVAVIGTGASSVQIVPSICGKVDQLYVFQRTPCWSAPRNDRTIPKFVQSIFDYIPGVLYLYRLFLFWFQELFYVVSFRKDSKALPFVRRLLEKYIRKTVKDPELARKLTPNFDPGCKRITPSDDYIRSFNRDNVHLITSKIDRVTKEGILTVDAVETKVDVIIYATGYSPLLSLKEAFDIYNGDGIKLNDIVENNPTAYLGISIPDYPNFFTLLGPHTGLGHNSVVWMIECEINYVGDCLRQLLQQKARAMSPKEERLRDFQALIELYMKNKVFAGGSGCLSWYLNDRGFNYTLWPSNLPHYWWLTKSVNMSDYILEK